MRKVKVFKLNPKTCRGLVEDGTAWFHEWGIDYEEFENGPGNYSAAIIERDDGTVQTVAANHIQFIEQDND